MRRYQPREEASRLALVLLDAAAAFDGRLPEMFAGFDRAETALPVEYPSASCPRAYAAASALFALRTLRCLDADEGRVRPAPQLPERIGRLELELPVTR